VPIYKRDNVYWIRYAGLDGKIVRESAETAKFREAEALLIQKKQMVKEGKQPVLKKIKNYTFKELAEEYLKWTERQRSFRSKKGFILQLVDRYGNLPLRSFNTMLIEQFQTERLE
jgi:hypothetical protein